MSRGYISNKYKLFGLFSIATLLSLVAGNFSGAKVHADLFSLVPYIVAASPENTSATANGEDEITIHIHVTGYRCSVYPAYPVSTDECSDGSEPTAYDAARELYIQYKSRSNFQNINASVGSELISEGEAFFSDSDGNVSVSFTSSAPQTTTVQFVLPGADSNYARSDVINIAFKGPETPSPGPSSPSKSESKTINNNNGTPGKLASEVTLSGIEYKGQNLSSLENVTFAYGESITLRGTAQPNAIVTLYIHSESRTVSFPADSTGNWAYAVSDLESGAHSIEADFRTSQDAKPTARKLLANFVIADAPVKTESKVPIRRTDKVETKKRSSILPAVITGVAIVLGLIGAAYFIVPLRKRFQKLLLRHKR